MSTERTVPDSARRLEEKRIKVDGAADDEMPTLEQIEVTSLQIDESYDEECDPYNRTGQFLVDAIKRRNRD